MWAHIAKSAFPRGPVMWAAAAAPMVMEPKRFCSCAEQRRMVVGNPGLGKSTLLNGIVQKNAFKSGFAEGGRGVTQIAQEVSYKCHTYVDTVGLTDPEETINKAKELTAALKKGGEYKIFFMVKQQQGRVMAQDQIVLERVLTAAPEIGGNYGIIVNQVTKGEKKFLEMNEGKNFKDMMALLCRNVPTTQFVILNMFDDTLDSEANVVKEPTSSMRTFLEVVPTIQIKPENVREVDGRSMDQMIEEVNSQNKRMAENQEEMKKQRQRANVNDFVKDLATLGLIVAGVADGGLKGAALAAAAVASGNKAM